VADTRVIISSRENAVSVLARLGRAKTKKIILGLLFSVIILVMIIPIIAPILEALLGGREYRVVTYTSAYNKDNALLLSRNTAKALGVKENYELIEVKGNTTENYTLVSVIIEEDNEPIIIFVVPADSRYADAIVRALSEVRPYIKSNETFVIFWNGEYLKLPREVELVKTYAQIFALGLQG